MATEQRIGIVIRRARERKRWTQRDLAKAVGVSRTTVDSWENDRSWPRNRIGALEDVLGISLNGTPAPRPERGPLADLEPFSEREQGLVSSPDLPDDEKRLLIEAWRAARARSEQRRAARDEGRSPRPGQAAG